MAQLNSSITFGYTAALSILWNVTMAKIITCNTNGIRAASRKGFFDWLQREQADVVCIQETKAQEHQLEDPVFRPEGYHCFYNDAIKKGYSGTALYSRIKPIKVTTSLGWDPLDSEGRYLQADFKGLSVISLYLPSGSSGDEAQLRKYRFMEAFIEHLRSAATQASGVYYLRRLEYLPQGYRPEKLAGQPQEFGLPARGESLAGCTVR